MNLLQITDVALTTAIDSTAQVAADTAQMNYWEMAKKGGPWIMIPLLILSIMAVYIFIERYVAIKKASKEDKTFMDRIKDYIRISIGSAEQMQKFVLAVKEILEEK